MSENEILSEIIKILKKDFKVKVGLKKNADITKIKNWDSIKHLDFIMHCEKKFKVKFNLKENFQLKTINDFIEKVLIKIKK